MINDQPSTFYVMTVYINIYNSYIFHLCKINFILVKIFILKSLTSITGEQNLLRKRL